MVAVVGDIVFEREAHRVWCAGREVDMSPREFAVLDCLFWKAPATVSAVPATIRAVIRTCWSTNALNNTVTSG